MLPEYFNAATVPCGATVDASSGGGLIASPDANGDGLYENDVVACTFTITVSSGNIRLANMTWFPYYFIYPYFNMSLLNNGLY